MSKWINFHKQNSEPKISAGKAISERLNDNLAVYLTTKKTGEGGKKNHPQDLLNQAKDSIGKISRIFEHMDWPIPSYEEISEKIKQVGLRAFTNSLLNDIVPTLRDDTGTKLNQKVIDSINFAGQQFKPPIKNLYDEYCKHCFEEEIADQFAQALILGFAQKVLDVERDRSIALKEMEIEKLSIKYIGDVENVLSESLSENDENNKLDGLKKAYKSALNEQDNADRDRQTKISEQFMSPLNELAQRTSIQGIMPTLDIDNIEQAKEFIDAFDKLIILANKNSLTIPGAKDAKTELNQAFEVSKMDLSDETKIIMMSKCLINATNKIIDAMNAELDVRLPNPVENSLWQRVVNLFYTTKEMKIYNKQQELLNKLTQGYKKDSFLRVEFTNDKIQIYGLDSANAKNKFKEKLNDKNSASYTLDDNGHLHLTGTEKWTESSVSLLKKRLDEINDDKQSLYRIKQIDVQESSVSLSMNKP